MQPDIAIRAAPTTQEVGSQWVSGSVGRWVGRSEVGGRCLVLKWVYIRVGRRDTETLLTRPLVALWEASPARRTRSRIKTDFHRSCYWVRRAGLASHTERMAWIRSSG